MASRAWPIAAAAAGLLGAIGAATAATPALVVDAQSGRVLFAERATDPWFPASITKLMTTYVALDLVRQGKVSMDTLITVTPDAAVQPPSKMGFKPGTQLTLENALKIIMVKSANDIATTIGDNLGGSVDGFAVMMNETARRLGMRESRWVNPSGLPDERQQTSARDMAILARALLRDFPEQNGLFQIGALKLGPNIIRNHNGLLGRYPGADGMKTGFICMGGFNVVATATQNGRKLITVVMGYGSARERDLRAADLFDTGFQSAGWGGQQVEDLPPSSLLAPPNLRPIVCGGRHREPEADDEPAAVAAASPNAENAVAPLFTPTGFAGALDNTPIPGSRRDLGPRVAFAPIPIWLGAAPGATAEGEAPRARGVGIAARPVRTKRLARTGATPPAAVTAFAPAPIATSVGIKDVTAKTRPAPRAALKDNLAAKPVAQTKPRTAAVAPPAKPKPAAAAKPRPEGAAARAAVKPKPAQAKASSATE